MKGWEHYIIVSWKPTKKWVSKGEVHADGVKAKIISNQDVMKLMMRPLVTSAEAFSIQQRERNHISGC